MPISINKRNKEKARQQKQMGKEMRRAQRRHDKNERTPAAPGEDPDLAGIVPGPQPLPYELEDA